MFGLTVVDVVLIVAVAIFLFCSSRIIKLLKSCYFSRCSQSTGGFSKKKKISKVKKSKKSGS